MAEPENVATSAPDTSSPKLAPVVPAVVTEKKHRVLVIGLVILVLFILATAGVLAVFLLRQSAEQTTVPIQDGTLPAGEDGDQTGLLPDDEVDSEETPLEASQPSIDAIIIDGPASNLGVTVTYQRGTQFSLAVSDVVRTAEETTSASYTPSVGEPHSLIRLFDEQGATLFQAPFTVATEATLEGGGANAVVPLDSSTTYLVLPVPSAKVPTRLEVSSDSGHVFDTHEFVFLELTEKVLQSPVIQTEQFSATKL